MANAAAYRMRIAVLDTPLMLSIMGGSLHDSTSPPAEPEATDRKEDIFGC